MRVSTESGQTRFGPRVVETETLPETGLPGSIEPSLGTVGTMETTPVNSIVIVAPIAEGDAMGMIEKTVSWRI